MIWHMLRQTLLIVRYVIRLFPFFTLSMAPYWRFLNINAAIVMCNWLFLNLPNIKSDIQLTIIPTIYDKEINITNSQIFPSAVCELYTSTLHPQQ